MEQNVVGVVIQPLKKKENMDINARYYQVTIKDGNKDKIFNIKETINDFCCLDYIIQQKNGIQPVQTFTSFFEEDDHDNTHQAISSNVNDTRETPTPSIKNIMKILQYGKYYDFKDKKVDIRYVCPKSISERKEQNIQDNKLTSKKYKEFKIKEFDFTAPKNIYCASNRFENAVSNVKRLWNRATYKMNVFWQMYKMRRNLGINNRTAGFSLSNVYHDIKDTFSAFRGIL